MKKIILSLIIVSFILIIGYLFYDSQINKAKKENIKSLDPQNKFFKTLSTTDLNPKSFITLFKEKYNKDSTLNFVSILGDFPENWVKSKDVPYLISIISSKEKCCGYMNIFSSTISNDNGEVGGFAIIFLNSYISDTKINMGLNCNPKTDEQSIRKIKKWYQNTANKN
ncbi:hypothetical protein ACHRVK_05095 [Flavobacterium plurextorum]|uniref:hypothetical protein n=1 Tax=Flavobacterium plurextorum TaxID=1114867 RepID=UPI003756AD08